VCDMGKMSWIFEAIKKAKFRTKIEAIIRIVAGKIAKPSDIIKCALCPNMCVFACPVGVVDGKETTSPAGKAKVAFLLEKYIEATPDTIEPIYICCACNACQVWCPFEFSVAEILLPIKQRLYEEGIYLKKVKEIVDNLEKYHFVFGEPPKRQDKEGEVLLFRGCVVSQYYSKLEETAMNLLETIGLKVKVISDEKCCGYPAYIFGANSSFKRIAKETARQLNELDVKYIVTLCPTCAYTLRSIYAKYGIKIKHDIYHISEVIKMHLNKINFNETNMEVVIHDPCALARHLGNGNILYEILSKIPGLKVKKPMRNGKETFCCGFGGGLALINYELAIKIAKERLKELLEEAKTIITACPACKKALESAGGTVYDITEFLNMLIKRTD